MIKKIRIRNFKIHKDSTELTFSPVTLLLGANSSGKSSIIQSLLIIKQSLESNYSKDPLIFNGAYCSVGDIQDVLNSKENDGQIKFEIELKNLEYDSEGDKILRKSIYSKFTGHIAEVKFGINFGYSGNPNQTIMWEEGKDGVYIFTKPKLQSTFVSAKTRETDIEYSAEIDKNLISSLRKSYETSEVETLFERDQLYRMKCKGLNINPLATTLNKIFPDLVVHVDSEKINRLKEDAIDEFIVNLCKHSAFISKTIEQIDGYERKLNYVTRQIALRSKTPTLFIGRAENNQQRTEKEEDIKSLISQYLTDIDRQIDQDYILEKFQVILNSSKDDVFEKSYSKLLERSREIITMSADKSSLAARHGNYLRSENSDDRVLHVNSFINSEFQTLYYIGPLREEPKVFYSRLGANDPKYVGPKGENTAFVLKYYGKDEISAILPPKELSDDWNPLNSERISSHSLEFCVVSWLRYLGVAENLEVNEQGKYGLNLKVQTEDRSYSDLMNVGVGVSQVLPIVVMGLAAEIGSVLILEQPELHLHPFVQSRLADFFCSLIPLKKQVVSETHSEHLVHRFRLRIAKDHLVLNDDFKVLFTKKDPSNGTCEISSINIDEYGKIGSWPTGFLDETTNQLRQLMEASIKKAKSKK